MDKATLRKNALHAAIVISLVFFILWIPVFCVAASCPEVKSAKTNAEKIAAYTQCLTAPGLDKDSRRELVYFRAKIYRKNRQYDEAIKGFSQAIELGGKPGLLHRRMGQVAMDQKNYKEAVSYFTTSLEYDDKEAYTHFFIAQSFGRLEGKEKQALTHFDQAVAMNPKRTSTFLKAEARFLIRKKQYEAAVTTLDSAIYNGPLSVKPGEFAKYNSFWSGNGDDKRTRSEKDSDRSLLRSIYLLRASANEKMGRHQDYFIDTLTAYEVTSNLRASINAMAWFYATTPLDRYRDGKRAVGLSKFGSKGSSKVYYMDTLAAAHAEAGEFEEAVTVQKEAIEKLKTKGKDTKGYEMRLGLYEKKIPFRQTKNGEPDLTAKPQVRNEIALTDPDTGSPMWEWIVQPVLQRLGGGMGIGYKGFNEAGFAQAKDEEGNWGLIDLEGNWAYVDPESRYPISAGDMDIFTKNHRGEYEYLRKDGTPLFDILFSRKSDFLKKNRGRAWVMDLKTKNKEIFYRLITTTGKTLIKIPEKTGKHGPISQGITSVAQDGLWGYVDLDGKSLTPMQYKECRPFKDGFGRVKTSEGSIAYVTKEGKQITRAAYIKTLPKGSLMSVVLDENDRKKKRIGFQDTNGNLVLDTPFTETYGEFGANNYLTVSKNRSVSGVIDRTGQFYSSAVKLPIPARLTSKSQFHGFYHKIKGKRFEGVKDTFGRIWIEAQFDSVNKIYLVEQPGSPSQIVVSIKDKGKYGFIRLKQPLVQSENLAIPTEAATAPDTDPSPDLMASLAAAGTKLSAKPPGYPALAFTLFQQAEHDYKLWQKTGDAQRFQRALFNVESALVIEPEKSELWFFQGLLLSELKADRQSMQLALTSFLKTVSLNSEHGRGQVMLAQSLFNNGLHVQAIDQIKFLFSKDSNLITAQLTSLLATSYIATGLVKEGSQYFISLSILYPKSVDIKMTLAVLQHSQGQTAEAISLLQLVVNDEDASTQLKNYASTLGEKWQKEGK